MTSSMPSSVRPRTAGPWPRWSPSASRRRSWTASCRPARPLRLAQISERLGVSVMPVRDALRQLEAERLVDISAASGGGGDRAVDRGRRGDVRRPRRARGTGRAPRDREADRRRTSTRSGRRSTAWREAQRSGDLRAFIDADHVFHHRLYAGVSARPPHPQHLGAGRPKPSLRARTPTAPGSLSTPGLAAHRPYPRGHRGARSGPRRAPDLRAHGRRGRAPRHRPAAGGRRTRPDLAAAARRRSRTPLAERSSLMRQIRIAVIPGDGIGQEVVPVAVDLLRAVTEAGGNARLSFDGAPLGLRLLPRRGAHDAGRRAGPAAALRTPSSWAPSAIRRGCRTTCRCGACCCRIRRSFSQVVNIRPARVPGGHADSSSRSRVLRPGRRPRERGGRVLADRGSHRRGP